MSGADLDGFTPCSLDAIKDAMRDAGLSPGWWDSRRKNKLHSYCPHNADLPHSVGALKFKLKVWVENGEIIAKCDDCGRLDPSLIGLKDVRSPTAVFEPTATPSTECPLSHQNGDSSDVLPVGDDSLIPKAEAPKSANIEPPRREWIEPELPHGREPGSDDEPTAPPAPESTPPSRFKFKPLSEIIKQHPGARTYWIRPYIPAASVILIYGDPACGKTTIAAEIDCCIATATDWRGMPAKQGKVLYVAAEDYYGARLRVEAWFNKNGLSADIDSIEMLDVPIVLADETDVDDLIAYVNSMSVKPAAITIDTLALSMGKYSENNDMQLFCNGATKIKRQTGITVIVIHHCGHGDKGRSRGGSQLPANADVIYQVERKEDICTMTCQKMKNGVEPPKLSWRMETQKTIWIDEDRQIITSVVLTPTENPEPEDRPKKPSRQQDVALNILRDLVRTQEANLSACGIEPSGARVLMSDWQAAVVKVIPAKATRNQVREALIDKGLVIEDGLFVMLGS